MAQPSTGTSESGAPEPGTPESGALASGGPGSGSASAAPGPGGAEAGTVVCGDGFRLPAAGGLRVDGRFPTSVGAGDSAVDGTVEVTAERPVSRLASPAADAFLVRDGKVVTTPLPQDAMAVSLDLAAGETRSVPASGSLVACGGQGGVRVPPGDYELYARVSLVPEDGEPAAAFGGPWPLTVTP